MWRPGGQWPGRIDRGADRWLRGPQQGGKRDAAEARTGVAEEATSVEEPHAGKREGETHDACSTGGRDGVDTSDLDSFGEGRSDRQRTVMNSLEL